MKSRGYHQLLLCTFQELERAPAESMCGFIKTNQKQVTALTFRGTQGESESNSGNAGA